MVYSRKVDGRSYTFGVSGRLYKSNVLLYDHQTESLWSQLMEKAVAGPMAGEKLSPMPSLRTSWEEWKRRHPETLVLSTDTGYDRNYAVNPYKGYDRSEDTLFPVGDVRDDLPAKAKVLGVEINGKAKAYPLSVLKEEGRLKDAVGGERIHIQVSSRGEIVSVRDEDGEAVNAVYSYWFAWQAFHPETEVHSPKSP